MIHIGVTALSVVTMTTKTSPRHHSAAPVAVAFGAMTMTVEKQTLTAILANHIAMTKTYVRIMLTMTTSQQHHYVVNAGAAQSHRTSLTAKMAALETVTMKVAGIITKNKMQEATIVFHILLTQMLVDTMTKKTSLLLCFAVHAMEVTEVLTPESLNNQHTSIARTQMISEW